MKFKAILTQDGVNLLDKRFLPSIDKIGRVCHLYLTIDHAIFLHNILGGDGVQSVAQFKKDVLFRDYRISSQNNDRIAFSIDVALLHRALRSAHAIQIQARDDTAAIQIKLVKKLPAGSRNSAPFLTFETKGLRSAVVQDVPISKPLSRADVAQLQTALDATQDLPQTLVQVPDLQNDRYDSLSLFEIRRWIGEGEGGMERSTSSRSCGAVVAKWLLTVQEVEEKGGDGGEEEAARVSVCIPPRNALLLMRCRSDPVKMADMTNRFWGSPKTPCDEDLAEGKDKEVEEEIEKRERN